MNNSNFNNPDGLGREALALLGVLRAGKARIAAAGEGYVLQAGSARKALPLPLLRELQRSRLLKEDQSGELRLVTPAEQERPPLNAAESPLYRLRYRSDGKSPPYLSQHQFDAGERLRADFERADFAARITANWGAERVDGGSHAAISDNRIAHVADSAIDARRRVHAAFDAVGPELAAVLYYVCCLAGGLEQAERFLALPPRSGKAILALSLTRLARHYRLLGAPPPLGKAGDIGHWALADYRPLMPPPAHRP